MATHQNIVDEQDEKVVREDTQGRSRIKSQCFGMADVVVVPFEVIDERLTDEETADDEEDVDAMGYGHVGETVERRIEEDALGMALHHTEDGESPQKIQAEDTLAVYLDAEKVPHLITLVTKVLPDAWNTNK